jgi:nucleotide-binding universal stress UspA family protein
MLIKNNPKASSKRFIEPLNVKQALVGLELEKSDDAVIKYFNFFTTQVPVAAAYFMHVIQQDELIAELYKKENLPLTDHYNIDDSIIKKMEERIDDLFTQKKDIYVEYDVKDGSPLEEMLATATALKIDLLVIGQKAYKANHNIFAKNMARKTTANALIIPEGAQRDISNILVPIDFSPNSVRALQTAISLHKQLKIPAQITCLNVYTIPSLKHFKLDAAWIQTKKTVESNIRDGFAAFLESYAGDYKNQVEVALVEKTQPGIAKYIMDYASENNCDFLCLGAKGHSNVHLLLMGSVAEEVLDVNVSIPTMIVK